MKKAKTQEFVMSVIETIASNFPTIATVGGSVLGGGFLGHWFKHKKDLADTLMTRVENLEELSKQERDACAAKIEVLSVKLRTTNANLAAIMLSLEMAPEKAAEIVRRMRVVMEEMEKEGLVPAGENGLYARGIDKTLNQTDTQPTPMSGV